MLAELRALPEGSRIRGWETLPGGDGPDAGKAMLQGSAMADAKARRELFEQGRDAIQTSADPLVVLARGLAVERSDLQRRMRERTGRALQVGRRWLDAQEAFRGKQFYPDANGTLRVSIASVKGYSPRDGVLNTPHTTVLGLLKKEAGREPFANPPALLEAARTRQQSRWFDKAIGDVPVCFLCDGDTTGGNSGSPVVNGRGELVGLNFDRVFEAVAGDFGWSAERSRNVVCDVRYVLWVVESVQPCARLLKELGV
jgi:hypothetical protein